MSGEIVDDAPLVPEGEYQLRYIDYRTCIAFKVPRVVVRFKILDHGPHNGKEIECWYRVNSLKAKPKKSGNFVVGKKSDLFRDYVVSTLWNAASSWLRATVFQEQIRI